MSANDLGASSSWTWPSALRLQVGRAEARWSPPVDEPPDPPGSCSRSDRTQPPRSRPFRLGVPPRRFRTETVDSFVAQSSSRGDPILSKSLYLKRLHIFDDRPAFFIGEGGAEF